MMEAKMLPSLNMYDKKELAYIAGLFDGEGTIFIEGKKSYAKGAISKTHYLQLSIANTHKETIDWVKSFLCFGQIIKIEQGNKPLYNWRGYGVEAIVFLKLLLPYLKIKREQALLAIEFQKSKRHLNGVKSRKDEIIKRDNYKNEIAKLNKFGFRYNQ